MKALRYSLSAVCLLALALPGLAAARPNAPQSPLSEACPVAHVVFDVTYYCSAEFSLRGSNGYRVTVSGEVDNDGPTDVTLSAIKDDTGVDYLGHGKFTSTQLKASFGRLGKIALRFQPSGKVRRVKVPKACVKGRPSVVTARLGTFVGTVRFRGEGGYTKVVAHQASGGIGDPLAIKPTLECEDHSRSAERQEAHAVHLRAAAKTPHGVVSFAAWEGTASPFTSTVGDSTSRRDPYTFLVLALERAQGLEIFRFVVATAPAGDFVFDSALGSAAVTLPAPFNGSASFRRNADGSTTWTGSLAVSLPGRGSVPLAGQAFKSELGTVAALKQQSEEETKLH